MNILIDIVPTSVTIEGAEYEINSNFRTSILFEMLMQDDEVDNEEKIVKAIELYYPLLPTNIDEAIDKILWFYRCGKEVTISKGVGKGKSEQIYNFDYDDEYIYSAFLDQYNIDLQDVEYLHWWKFKAMFKALKEDNEIVKIMGYRALDLKTIADKKQKQFYSKVKKLYEIPKSKTEIEKINAIEEALLIGEDVVKLLQRC